MDVSVKRRFFGGENGKSHECLFHRKMWTNAKFSRVLGGKGGETQLMRSPNLLRKRRRGRDRGGEGFQWKGEGRREILVEGKT